MKRNAVALAIAAAIVAGCSSAQTMGTVPSRTGVIAQGQAHGASRRSWMLPGTSGQDLLYASGLFEYPLPPFGVEVFSYPKGSVVGQLKFQGLPLRLCSDRSGDVFIPVLTSRSNNNFIYEYAHGGTEPIAILTDSGVPFGCAVDPTTG